MFGSKLVKAIIWTGVTAATLAVFTMYTRGDFLVTLANQMWTCF